MRVESSVTSVSWIPSEAIKGMVKMPFEVGVGHYDEPLPDVVDVNNLEVMRDNDQFRFANHLRAWIRVENGRISARSRAVPPPRARAGRRASGLR